MSKTNMLLRIVFEWRKGITANVMEMAAGF